VAITTWDQLTRAIEKEVFYGLKIVGNDIKSIIADYVKKKVYSAYSPTMYDRTGDLLNSLDVSEVKKVGSGYEVTVFFNTDFIRSNIVDGGWNQHMNAKGKDDEDINATWKGIPVNELIPVFIEEGVENSLWDRDGIESMKYVQEMLAKTDRHLKVLSRVLRMRGFNVKIV